MPGKFGWELLNELHLSFDGPIPVYERQRVTRLIANENALKDILDKWFEDSQPIDAEEVNDLFEILVKSGYTETSPCGS